MIMSRYSVVSKVAKCGSYDSKYFSNPKQFDEDVKLKLQKTEEFKNRIRKLLDDELRKEPDMMEYRVHNIVEVLREIKEKYNV
jgi:hypothetical protein